MVKVLVFGQALQQVVDDSEFECEIAQTMPIREFLETHAEQFGRLESLLHSNQVMMTINQKISTLESPLRDGDTLKLTHQFNPELEGARWHNP